jgi:hypothetical protein
MPTNLLRRTVCAAFMGLACLAPGVPAGNSFTATYTIQMSVDASKAKPESASDRALIQGASMLGSFEVGTLVDTGSLAGGVFRLRSVGTGSRALKTLISDNRLEMDRSSEGQVRQGNLLTLKFSDKRGSSPLLTYAADAGKKRYELRRGGQVTESGPLRYSNVDIALLPYLFLGRAAPTAPFSVAYTDGKSVKLAGFRVTREELAVAGTRMPTTKLVSAPRTAAEPLIEIWLRTDDSFPLRVRVGMSAQYGAVADQQIKALPPLFRAS